MSKFIQQIVINYLLNKLCSNYHDDIILRDSPLAADRGCSLRPPSLCPVPGRNNLDVHCGGLNLSKPKVEKTESQSFQCQVGENPTPELFFTRLCDWPLV